MHLGEGCGIRFVIAESDRVAGMLLEMVTVLTPGVPHALLRQEACRVQLGRAIEDVEIAITIVDFRLGVPAVVPRAPLSRREDRIPLMRCIGTLGAFGDGQ